METLLDEICPQDEFVKFERAFQSENQGGRRVSPQTQFNYAYCLVRSRHKEDILRGVILLEDLCSSGDPIAMRDYLYYLAFANTRLKDYERARDCIKKFLAVEPSNRQAQELEAIIRDRLTKEGLKGLVITGGVAVAASVIAGIGIAVIKNLVNK
jgi:fission 1 protein